MIRAKAALLAGCLILVCGLSAGWTSQDVSQFNKKLGTVHEQIQSVKSKLAAARRKERAARTKYYSTQRQLNDTRVNLGETRNRLIRSRRDLRSISSDLRTMEARLQEKRLALTERLTDAYKSPPSSYLVALVTSQDSWSAMTRTKMIQQIVESDKSLLEDIRASRDEIQRRKQAHERKVAQINSLQTELSGQEQMEKQLAWSQKAQYDSIRKDRVSYERHLDELIRESNRIASMIRRMQETPEGRKRMAETFKGGFIRPVGGRVTSPFGMRYHPILHKTKLHTGVDLSCSTGTPVKAAAAGTVIISGWMNAYGYTVVIDHGGGVSTLYGHCSRLSVGVGQEVSQGQVIAKSGSTGWSTGPHLHWEVRRNGKPVNPL